MPRIKRHQTADKKESGAIQKTNDLNIPLIWAVKPQIISNCLAVLHYHEANRRKANVEMIYKSIPPTEGWALI